MPGQADLRWNWAVVRLSAIDPEEMHELVLDAWRLVVPKSVAAAYLAGHELLQICLANRHVGK